MSFALSMTMTMEPPATRRKIATASKYIGMTRIITDTILNVDFVADRASSQVCAFPSALVLPINASNRRLAVHVIKANIDK